MASKTNLIWEEDIRKAMQVLRAVNHALRKEILLLLDKHGKLNVTELFTAIGVEQSICSQHLGILRNAGIIEAERIGKYNHYFIVKSRLEQINCYSNALINTDLE